MSAALSLYQAFRASALDAEYNRAAVSHLRAVKQFDWSSLGENECRELLPQV
jgi:hypothetical protein